jgi:hypothetical protein
MTLVTSGQCLLWVNSGHRTRSASCPLYPQKRILTGDSGVSAKRHYEPYALQHRGGVRSLTMRAVLGGNVRFLLRVIGEASKEASDENWNCVHCNDFTRRDFGGS